MLIKLDGDMEQGASGTNPGKNIAFNIFINVLDERQREHLTGLSSHTALSRP